MNIVSLDLWWFFGNVLIENVFIYEVFMWSCFGCDFLFLDFMFNIFVSCNLFSFVNLFGVGFLGFFLWGFKLIFKIWIWGCKLRDFYFCFYKIKFRKWILDIYCSLMLNGVKMVEFVFYFIFNCLEFGEWSWNGFL